MFKKSIILIILFIILLGLILVYIDKSELGYVGKDNLNNELTDEELKEKIGQMIMTGFRGTEILEGSDAYNMIKDVKVGGVVLFDYDVFSNSFPRNIVDYDQTKKLISDIQSYSSIPLFVAVDAEGGKVNRLKEEYGFTAVLSAEEMGRDKTLKTTDKESLKLALELKELGFNMNLAPVVDLNINPSNPIIGALGRSFSQDKEETAKQAEVFIENHLKNGIVCVAKHFPGQGSAEEDTHLGLADITESYKEEEFFPYYYLNEKGLLKAVMAAHTINRNIDNDYPAALSSVFLEDILRNQIGFGGVIISDDMQMSAITNNYNLDEAVIKAVNAGIDIILISNNTSYGYDKDIAHKVRDIIFNAVRDNRIKEDRVIESYNRILDLKREFRIILFKTSYFC
ncbi:MAG: glycoside hydrolase family 3 N-terminal domain-containing protein [Candidatus Pacebacteria bacterium]|nr:glycoside hydrolase family 3 N-terminal domain-containing protein [Candidatus Paceibacterota bacterium]